MRRIWIGATKMQYQKLTRRVLLAMFVLSCTTAGATEVSWVDGIAGPATWTIEPSRPADIDKITFSGPVGHYWNTYEARKDLGGRPILNVDSENKLVDLSFGSGNGKRSRAWDPISGIEGTFGPLEAGSWLFYCDQGHVQFSIKFEVLDSERLYYVDAAATGEATGASWHDAFVDLQTALMTVPKGSEIRVAQGTYRPNQGGYYDELDRNAAFHISGVTVKGGFAGSSGSKPHERDTIAYETTLSGDLYGDDVSLDYISDMMEEPTRTENAYHVVVTSGAAESTVLDGLTITGGIADGPENEDTRRSGGGIYNVQGSPTVRDCVITGNAADYHGAGIYTRDNGDAGPVFVDCLIFGNWCHWWGGGVYKGGGGDATFQRCVISSNGARYRGGGVCSYRGTVILSNCNITGNMTTESLSQGGGIYGSEASAGIEYSTIVGNVSGRGSAVAYKSDVYYTEVELDNCIIWNGPNAIRNEGRSSMTVDYCNVQGGWAGTGNIDADPCFVETGYWDLAETPSTLYDDVWYDGDYRLLWDSPCVGAGNPRMVPEADELDLYSNPRLSGAIVDMGAHEVRNVAPVARTDTAPTGFTLDGTTGIVTFDASDSYDPEGYPLNYRWYRDNELISTDVAFKLELALGEHNYTLIVNDGAGDSKPVEITATVHQVMETELRVWPTRVKRSGGLDKFLVTLKVPGDSADDCDEDFMMLLYPGGIEAMGQNAYRWLGGNVRLTGKFDRDEFLANVSETGNVEIQAVGRLKDGRYFSGTGTLRVR